MHDLCLNEVSLRDGIQSEGTIVPTELKVNIVEALVKSGFKSIQLTSFVHPKRVPQMADAEALVAAVPNHSAVMYTGLVLNERGLDRALDTKLGGIDLSMSCSNSHSLKNTGLSRAEALAQTISMVQRAKAEGRHVRAGLQCAFGCAYEGLVPFDSVRNLALELIDAGCDQISLADSTGDASPDEVARLIDFIDSPVPLCMHFHDSRGMAIANLLEAYRQGVRSFDTSLGGLGGCPFIPEAAGNVATEDALYLFEKMGMDLGIDRDDLLPLTESLESALGRTFPSPNYQLKKREGKALKRRGANL